MLKLKTLKTISCEARRVDRQPHEEFELFRSDWQPSDELYAGLALEFGLSAESIRSICGRYITEFIRQNIRHEAARASSWDRKFLEFIASALQKTEPQTATRLRRYRKSLKRKSDLLRHGDRVSREIVFTDWDHYSEKYEEYVRDPDYAAHVNKQASHIPVPALYDFGDYESAEYREYSRLHTKASKEASLEFREKKLRKVRAIKKLG